MSDVLRTVIVPLVYLTSAVLFIYGLKLLGRVRSASRGNQVAALAMLLAVLGTLLELGTIDWAWIVGGIAVGGLIGAVTAYRVPMTAMPEMVALFNGFGGAASALVALSVYWLEYVEAGAQGTVAEVIGGADAVTVCLSVLIGALTFSGSLIAYLKLQGTLANGAPILLPARHLVNLALSLATVAVSVWYAGLATDVGTTELAVLVLTALSLALGVLLVIPIGGADMPVVVSLLNSYSGVAAAMAGFVIGNPLLIIAGAMVGAAGLILTQIMCVAMNRSLLNVLVGGFGQTAGGGGGGSEYVNVKSSGAEEAAMVLDAASTVIFVPGYGLAVAQAQHVVREMAEILEKKGVKVLYAIHPVAGRMPGHMNVLLAEADVPYEQLVEMDQINPEFSNTDVVLVVGANDVVNPIALRNTGSPIDGMPILEVHHAKTVFIIKRSLGSGYAGIKNELFEYPNAMMLFGDAKKMLQSIVTELKGL